jgi:protein-S-isoprenylcysteine O-methyltransferase Ste14
MEISVAYTIDSASYTSPDRPVASRRGASGGGGALVVLLLIVSLIAPTLIPLLPRGDESRLIVIAPPWYDRTATALLVAAASGRLVAFQAAGNVVIADSPGRAFAAALYDAGAWLVLRPPWPAGCAAPLPTPSDDRPS